MPTPEEAFDHAIEAIRSLTEHPCSWCDGTKVRTESYIDENAEPGKRLQVRKIACEECDENGVVRHGRLSPDVLMGVFCMVMRETVDARERGDFDLMNRILDCGHRLALERIAFELQTVNPEDLEAMMTKANAAAERPIKPKMTVRATEPLTEDEIEDMYATRNEE